MTDVQVFSEKIIKNIEKVIIGKRDTIEKVVINLLGKGHLLIEDVPGTGKTMLARSLATSIGGSFNRIQFTPDMLPSDVTGVSIFNQASREFEFRAGPIMAQIVLADEINRATPKTQAALLEAMSEQQITVDGTTHKLPDPFMVLATQNPIEYEGTFPLPEAQLDRFFMRARLGYPDFNAEMSVLDSQQYKHPLEDLKIVVEVEEVLQMQALVREIHVAESMRGYIVKITRQTRIHADAYLGASTRGSLALFRASQAKAAMEGRDYVLPDDIKALAKSCLAHRVILVPASRLRDVTTDALLDEIIASIPVPGGDLTPNR